MRKAKKGLWLIILTAIGFLAYKLTGKAKTLKKEYDTAVVFKGKSLDYNAKDFSVESIAVVFGGLEIDLTGANLIDEVNTLFIYGEFSGISIKVPEEWHVEVSGQSKNSAVSNKVDLFEEDESVPKLIIEYNLKYSALEVKH